MTALRIGAAGGVPAPVLVFGIGDQDVTRRVLVALFSIWALVLVNRGTWSIGPSGLVLIACLAYFALAISWSLDWRHGIHRLAQVVPFAILYLVLSRSDKIFEFLPRACVIVIIGALALDSAYPGLHGGFGNRNFLAEAIILASPFAALVLRDGPIRALVTIAAFGWALFYLTLLNKSNIPAFAAVFVLIVLVASFRLKLAAMLIAANAAVWMVALKGERAVSSVLSRIELLYNTTILWLDAPFFGNGTGGFNAGYAGYQEKHIAVMSGRSIKSIIGSVSEYAGAAHNEVAQILAEHGIFGLLLAQLFFFVLIRHWREKPRDALDKAAAWSLGLALWLSMIGFPLHNAATALIAVVAAAVMARSERAWLAGSGCSVVSAAVGGLTALAILGSTFVYAGAQHRLAVARAIINTPGEDSLYAVRENLASYYLWPFDQLVRRQLIMSVAKAAIDYGDNLQINPDAADKIYAISQTAGEKVPSTLFARANYLLASGRFKEGSETEEILDQLKKSASLQLLTWYADSIYATATGDRDRALRSIGILLSKKDPLMPEEEVTRLAAETLKEMTK